MTRQKVIISIAAVVIVLLSGFLVWRYRFDLQRDFERSGLPVAQERRELPVAEETAPADRGQIPSEINLAVPFTAQAPNGIWDLPYKEFCEEASVFMVMRYLEGRSISGPAEADAEMLKIKDFEERFLGEYQDTDAAQTAAIFTEYFKYPNVEIVENPTADQIRQAVASGKPVIVPAAGRLLGNPYFQQPGPLYHMVVIKGYTADGDFIVNDPGTRRGADFVYSEAVLMNAMHDWRDDENITAGRKVILIAG